MLSGAGQNLKSKFNTGAEAPVLWRTKLTVA